jgi:hypothetical protein
VISVPLLTTNASPGEEVISVAAPEKTNPVDPIVLFVRVWDEVVSARVIVPDGSVASVVPVVVSVRGLAPLVVKASAKEIVFPSGIVSVPVVSVTVSPPTFSALKA